MKIAKGIQPHAIGTRKADQVTTSIDSRKEMAEGTGLEPA
jgi:hypothetical protein